MLKSKLFPLRHNTDLESPALATYISFPTIKATFAVQPAYDAN